MPPSTYNKIISLEEYPESQKKNIEHTDVYQFERIRHGKILSPSGLPFGSYLYRNVRNRVLIASYNPPSTSSQYYTSCEIGCNTDALLYYKNM